MKKKFFVFLALIGMSVFGVAAQTVASGITGKCTWVLTGVADNYTLTISGAGAMEDYSSDAPWYSFCDGITTVVIEQGVSTIGVYAFRDCSGLTSVALPPSVVAINEGAFAFCRDLTSVTIPPLVATIGNVAFAGCRGLTSVTIPPSVVAIGSGAFFDCRGLTRLEVDGENRAYASVDGVLFNKDKTTLVHYPGGKAGSYAIPSSVIAIDEGAFRRCHGLTSVVIGKSVTEIASHTFANCIGLTSVTIPPSVATIGYAAFANCSDLTSVTNLSTSPQVITGDHVFGNVDLSEVALRVPAGSVEAYREAPFWRKFGRIEAVGE